MIQKLTILLFLLLISNINAQVTVHDTVHDTVQVFKFSGKQVKQIRLTFLERDFLKIENDSLNNRVNLYKQALTSSDVIIAMQDSVIAIKERQLKKFESTPQITQIVKKTGFWTWCGVVVSSVAVGLITGYVLR